MRIRNIYPHIVQYMYLSFFFMFSSLYLNVKQLVSSNKTNLIYLPNLDWIDSAVT